MYRPYPNQDRARRQVERHDAECGPFAPDAPIPEWRLNMARQANAALAAAALTLAPRLDRFTQALKDGGAGSPPPALVTFADLLAKFRYRPEPRPVVGPRP
jgi:hypothetical protein